MQNFLKTILTIVATVIVVICVVGFAYPYVTHTHVARAPVSSEQSSETFGEKIINDLKKVAGSQTATVQNAIVASDVVATDTTKIKTIEATSTSDMLPIYFGVKRDNLIDVAQFPDNNSLYSIVRSLAVAPSTSRALDVTSFSAPNTGYYVYFAWPASFEANQKYSCKAITMMGKPTGTQDCFSTGLSNSLLFNTTDLVHRELSNFVDENGKIITYELYRAHYFISPGSTVYYKTF